MRPTVIFVTAMSTLVVMVEAYGWAARQIGSQAADIVTSVSTDQQGNVYIAGHYGSSPFVIYDSLDSNALQFVNVGGSAGFIAKYSSNGSILWAARQDGLTQDQTQAVQTDSQGNPFIAGFYTSTCIVYDSLGFGVKTLTLSGGYGSYLLKYQANGSVLWTSRQDGTGNDLGNAVATDQQGNAFVAGQYSAPLIVYDSRDINVISLLSTGGGAFVVKYLSNGSFAWASRQDGGGSDYAQALTTDQQGNVYVAGYYSSSPLLVYDSNSSLSKSLANSGGNSAYMAKYTSSGSFLWATRQDGIGNDAAQALSTDYQGNVYVGGYYGSSPFPIYDSSDSVAKSLLNAGGNGAFIVKLTSSGSFVWAANMDGTGNDAVFSLANDQQGNLYACGFYGSPLLVMYDSLGQNIKSLVNGGSNDGFVITFTQDGLWNSSQQFVIQTSCALPSSTSATYTSLNSQSTLSSATLALSIVQSISQQSTPALPPVQSTTTADVGSSLVSTTTASNTHLLLLQQASGSVSNTVTSSLSNKLTLVTGDAGLFNQLTIYIILAAVGVVGLSNCILYYCLRQRRKRFKVVRMTDSNTTQMSQLTNMSDGTSTAIVTSHVLAVPRFLSLRSGIDIRQLDQIAKGGGGSIHHCQVLDASQISNYDGSQLVIKNFGKDVNQLSTVRRDSFYQEISMLYLFRDQSPFARMYGFTEQPATIVLKLYPLGSFKQFILSENRASSIFTYSMPQILKLQVKLTQGFSYMHQKEFAHCDVKPDNVLLEAGDGYLEPRITDFGISRVLSEQALHVKAFQISLIKGASISYAAPEVIFRFRRGLSEKEPEVWKSGDVYAVSVLVYEMLLRKNVWALQ